MAGVPAGGGSGGLKSVPRFPAIRAAFSATAQSRRIGSSASPVHNRVSKTRRANVLAACRPAGRQSASQPNAGRAALPLNRHDWGIHHCPGRQYRDVEPYSIPSGAYGSCAQVASQRSRTTSPGACYSVEVSTGEQAAYGGGESGRCRSAGLFRPAEALAARARRRRRRPAEVRCPLPHHSRSHTFAVYPVHLRPWPRSRPDEPTE